VYVAIRAACTPGRIYLSRFAGFEVAAESCAKTRFEQERERERDEPVDHRAEPRFELLDLIDGSIDRTSPLVLAVRLQFSRRRDESATTNLRTVIIRTRGTGQSTLSLSLSLSFLYR
jgi:hypothetical protein